MATLPASETDRLARIKAELAAYREWSAEATPPYSSTSHTLTKSGTFVARAPEHVAWLIEQVERLTRPPAWQSEIDEFGQQLDELRDHLRSLEWVSVPNPVWPERCCPVPSCGVIRGSGARHAPTCWLAEAIGAPRDE
jgi:hypothetical protein